MGPPCQGVPRTEGRPTTWLFTIAVRLAINERKRHVREPQRLLLGAAADVPDFSTPETERARHELGHSIVQAAQALSVDQRAAFVLAEFHGMSIREIAAALEVPEGTIKTRLFRAPEQLRARLGAFEKGPAE